MPNPIPDTDDALENAVTNQDTPDQVKVEQRHRDVAIQCGIEFLRWTPKQIEMVQTGAGDNAPLVQAFARFEAGLTPPVVAQPTAEQVREAAAITPVGEPCRLDDCPPGPFLFDGRLGFRSEYWTSSIKPDAYCMDSGEYFWGGTDSTMKRAALMVQPVEIATLSKASDKTTPVADDGLREALKRIESGSIPGASDYAVYGMWQQFVTALQAEARAALSSDTAQGAWRKDIALSSAHSTALHEGGLRELLREARDELRVAGYDPFRSKVMARIDAALSGKGVGRG